MEPPAKTEQIHQDVQMEMFSFYRLKHLSVLDFWWIIWLVLHLLHIPSYPVDATPQWHISTKVIDVSRNVSLHRSSCLIGYMALRLWNHSSMSKGDISFLFSHLSSLFRSCLWLPFSPGYTAHPKPQLQTCCGHKKIKRTMLYQVQMWDCEKVIDEEVLL